jgi:hypothetical protein
MLEADQRHFSDKIEAGALYVNNDGNYVRTDVEIVDSTMVDPNKRESLEAAGGTNPIIAAEQELDFINIRNKAIDSEADLIYGGQNMTENMMMMDIDNDALNDADMFEIRDDYFAERKPLLEGVIAGTHINTDKGIIEVQTDPTQPYFDFTNTPGGDGGRGEFQIIPEADSLDTPQLNDNFNQVVEDPVTNNATQKPNELPFYLW